MCDTMVALGNSTVDGQVYFAKNSDRQPNEPHILIQIPRRHYSPGAKLKCTYIEMEQIEETFAVLLLKPSWTGVARWAVTSLALTLAMKRFSPGKNTGSRV